MRQLEANQVRRAVNLALQDPAKFVVLQADAINGVERAQDVFVGAQAEGAQEDRAQEFALPINTAVENVLLVELELHPRATIRDDLSQKVSAVVGGLKEHAGRA